VSKHELLSLSLFKLEELGVGFEEDFESYGGDMSMLGEYVLALISLTCFQAHPTQVCHTQILQYWPILKPSLFICSFIHVLIHSVIHLCAENTVPC